MQLCLLLLTLLVYISSRDDTSERGRKNRINQTRLVVTQSVAQVTCSRYVHDTYSNVESYRARGIYRLDQRWHISVPHIKWTPFGNADTHVYVSEDANFDVHVSINIVAIWSTYEVCLHYKSNVLNIGTIPAI